MSTQVAVPFVHDGLLTREQLITVVSDIEAGTELLAVNVKRLRTAHSDEQPVGLRAALDQLLSGTVTGIQVRYKYAGREFWDTLLFTSHGFRIVRIDHTAALAGL